MKRLVLGMMAILLVGCAGMAPVRDSDKTFSQVFESPGHSKDFLYEKVRIWMAQNFASSKQVIEYENKQEGTIIGNSVMKYPCSGLECVAKYNWTIPFTMRVDVKEDKFRLTYSNLQLAWPASTDSLGYHPPYLGALGQQGDYDSAKPILLGMGEDLRAHMATETKIEKW